VQRTRVVVLAVVLAVAGAVALAAVIGAAARRAAPPVDRAARPDPDPAARLGAMLDRQGPDRPYRHPTPDERAEVATAFDRVLSSAPEVDRAAVTALAALGMSTVEDIDPVTGRRYALVISDPAAADDGRAWGAVFVDLSSPVRRAFQVPHPRTDIATEHVGLALFRRLPGSILMVAGAHRRAAGGDADVAHNTGSVFHALSAELAGRRVPQVQLHGYADQNLPDADVVVSAGAGQPGPLALGIAERLTAYGMVTCRAWAKKCGRLEGTANAQGRTADEAGSPFVHVEISNSVRSDEGRRADLVAAFAAAHGTT
jgi:hypothetical protein